MRAAATPLAVAIAAVLTTSHEAQAATVSALLQSVVSYSSSGSVAANLSSSTATWSFDTVSGVLSQTGGLFDARYSITAASTLFRHSITGMVLGGGAAASATTYTCAEGNFGGNVGASLCGNYNFGANFYNESSTSWGPGTSASRTLGGDDQAVGPQQSIAGFNGTVTIEWAGTTLTLSNATPTSGYTWTLAASSAFAPEPVPGFSVIVDEYGIASRITNLEILGIRYDVDFSCDPHIGLNEGCAGKAGSDMFFGNEAGAIAAVDAINGALIAAGADMVENWYMANYGAGYFNVPYSTTEAIESCGVFIDQSCEAWNGLQPWVRNWGAVFPDSRALVGFSLMAAVPVPAAAWLFGSALLGLGALRRRPRSEHR